MYTFEQLLKRTMVERESFIKKSIDFQFDRMPFHHYEEIHLDLINEGKTRILFYKPETKTNEPFPVYITMHGGGFIMGGADLDDPFSRQIATKVGCAVINIDYKLSPEYKFPVAIEECYAVTKWVNDNAESLGINPSKIAVGGYSAGGNIAAVLCLLAQERREFSIHSLVIDCGAMTFADYQPFQGFGDNLHLKDMDRPSFFAACYVNEWEEVTNPFVSPLLSRSFAGHPPTLVISAELDTWRKGYDAYAEKLKAVNIKVDYHMFRDCHHCFTVWPDMGPDDASKKGWEVIFSYLTKQFRKEGRE